MSGSALRPAVVAAAAARFSYAALRAQPPGGAETWTRTNHRGEDVTLLEGPAVVLGAIAGAAVTPLPGRQRLALMLAGAGAAAFGGYDDLAGDGANKGFHGHLSALGRGELTTGAIKIAGIGATGLVAAIVAGHDGRKPGAGGAVADAIINAGLIAGGANLLNLFDLRPGRAAKVAIGTGALLAASGSGRRASAAPVAAAAALLPEDLGERSMLGDAGANAIGAMLGVAATGLPRPVRIAALAGVIALTAASEKVSFTEVIERTGPLRWLDMLGRRPAATAPAAVTATGPDADAAEAATAPSDGDAANEPAAAGPR